MGVCLDRYLSFRRVNLCTGDAWTWTEARDAARRVRDEARATRAMTRASTLVIALGRKVRRAFDPARRNSKGQAIVPDAWQHRVYEDDVDWIHLPHPSGLCRAWNSAGSVERARDLLSRVAPTTPWGEADRAWA
jgi:hypothetical protein